MEDPQDLELQLNRFNRLVKELLQGEVRRTSFQPWEVEFLLDLEACRLTRSRRNDALKRYQRAVQRQLERRQFPPMRFGDFLRRRTAKTELAPVALCAQDASSLDPQVPAEH
ncbi:MAG TPA: hypothetical protein VMT86_00515 [Bryobacteraceae bacterium]|nr:hypothetical protein [Bryobacteraceae bacterium]